MTSIQVLIAVAVTVGVAGVVTIALAVAGVLFQRDPARAANAHPFTIPAQHAAQQPAQTASTRELVLR